MTTPNPTPAHDPPPTGTPGCLSYVLLAVIGLWVLGATYVVQVFAWTIDQTILFGFSADVGGIVGIIASGAHVLAAALPVVLLALLAPPSPLRAVYRLWCAALVFIAVLGLVRLFPRMWGQAAAVAQIVLSLIAIVVLVLWRRGASQRVRPGGGLAALALAPVAALPFLMWGALGSPLDTVLNLLAGLALGLFAGLLFDRWLFAPLADEGAAAPVSQGLRLALAAWGAVVALMILGGGYGFGGTQRLLLIALPPLGLAVGAIGLSLRRGASPQSAWLFTTMLVGLVAGAALAFVDPDEMVMILGDAEILAWVLRAARVSAGLGLLAGIGALIWAALAGRPAVEGADSHRRSGGLGCAVVLALAGLAWLAAVLAYAFPGQPGFYGDRFFVILNEQADLSAAPGMADREARLSYVYGTLVATADGTQADMRSLLDRLGLDYQPYYLVNAIEVDAGPLVRAYLSTRPEVDRILDSPRLRPLPAPLPLGEGNQGAPGRPQWNITSIGADRVWDELGITGEGIVVGQSDSGAEGTHPALASGYRGQGAGDDYNWLDPWNGTASPTDLGGHGTHTLGSAVGRGGIGVAPGATWFACVNLARNLANPPLYLDCMQFMLAPYPQGGDPLHDGDPTRAAHVINNSWGCPPLEGCDVESLGPGVAALRAAGVFVMSGAGNEGPSCGSVASPPAIYDAAFSIAAVDEFGDLAFFSSRGPVTVDGSQRLKPDLAAPGVDVLSSTPGGTYAEYSGTSMAGPHVVGAVALMWSANPALIGDIDRTEQILRDTARPYTGTAQNPGGCDDGPTPNNGAGAGLLDAYAAVRAALGR
jgi:subtilisin family serine protease